MKMINKKLQIIIFLKHYILVLIKILVMYLKMVIWQ